MIKKNVNISVNLHAFAVEATEIKISVHNNKSLSLYNSGLYIGSVDLSKYRFQFSWATDYTNYYRLIEK